MKITISTNDVIQAIYANSALQAEAAQWPNGVVAALLSTDAEPALRRISRDAFAAVIAATTTTSIPWQLTAADDIQLAAACDESTPPLASQSTATASLQAASTAMLAAIIWRGIDNSRFAQQRELAINLLQPITTPAPPSRAAIIPAFY